MNTATLWKTQYINPKKDNFAQVSFIELIFAYKYRHRAMINYS